MHWPRADDNPASRHHTPKENAMQIKSRSHASTLLRDVSKKLGPALKEQLEKAARHAAPQADAVTLSIGDRLNASRLQKAMNGKLLPVSESLAKAPSTQVSTGRDGTVRGPEGQPLIPMKRDNGQKVYVDPNTNQYYVGSPAMNFKKGQTESVRGPYALPSHVQFSNSHFSDADVHALTPKRKPSPSLPPPVSAWPQHGHEGCRTTESPEKPRVIPLIDNKVGDGFGR
jgi:hypothetical protein